MNWLIIQEAGRHAENAQFRESLCVQQAFAREGHESHCFGPGQVHTSPHALGYLLDWCDAILFLENYDESGWTPNLHDIKKPKLFWSIDGHCARKQHIQLCRRNRFDIVLNSCYSCVAPMAYYCSLSTWFPNCYPSDLVNCGRDIRKIDFGYCGSLGPLTRSILLERLASHSGLHLDINVLGQSMVSALQNYIISFNRNIGDDINYRTFESMGAGAMLITNETSGLQKLFRDGEHLVLYDNFDDCIEKVHYYINHPEERQAIATAGTMRVQQEHTYDNRVRRMCELCELVKEVL